MTLTPEQKKELKSRSRALEPVMRIGKQGLTQNVIVELKQHLKNRKLVKVKFLRAAVESSGKKELAAELASKVGAELVDLVGFVVVLYRASSESIKRPKTRRP